VTAGATQATMPMGQLPVLRVDDLALCQTAAIGALLGAHFDLDGRTAYNRARCIMFAGRSS